MEKDSQSRQPFQDGNSDLKWYSFIYAYEWVLLF